LQQHFPLHQVARRRDDGRLSQRARSSQDDFLDDLLRLTDQCVKCGYCLPHCPTFRLRQDEAESPRGRVALIQGLLSDELGDSPRLRGHLGNCLECLACEPACPSLVQFGTLMDGARARLVERRPRWRRRLLRTRLDLLASPRLLPLPALLARIYRGLGLGTALRRLGLLRRGLPAVLDGILMRLRSPARPGQVRSAPPRAATAAGAELPEIALFLGCVSRALEPGVAAAAASVLRRLGHAVQVPDAQGCCGAMHRHNGLPDQADALLVHNRSVFGDRRVAGLSSACVAELQQGLDAVELCRLLVDLDWPAHVRPRPLPATVAVHEPCSHRNQLRDAAAIYALLARIPALRVEPLPGNERCCGAAGAYLLDHPDTALALAAEKVRHVAALAPRYLVTTNTGCAAHLAARLRADAQTVEVLHPVELLARQLDLPLEQDA
jgi:glycolate oxidase iron-sulfur subunit